MGCRFKASLAFWCSATGSLPLPWMIRTLRGTSPSPRSESAVRRLPGSTSGPL
ncbi:hypothetical protein B0T16DRAFT_411681 [Cercophora newfieldiana]|uniref:Uncharacterized protein n=1 Tax=Cercophora newfieldiana TaxID=92897 RepID=A0AA39Y586_9PEZI|nr:hypothetical protein B0T16DRAFT_411681 [Cercophora newfieldiana]